MGKREILSVKNVDDLPKHGSRDKVSDKDEKMIINMFFRNPQLTLRQGAQKLKQKGLDMLYEPIRRNLKANDLKWH